ncbi:hypothetical protein BV22DRAFT_1021585 [Leucogyrophana mollusca]|uniref:Uncharacterized protein n=1 Tax=Leucogyrophana mollusca TaxID=85980 RepID=A0ACB8B3D6_9AGAM|nr:hypothetical protein BV22DRAFT_1021585 [Leucogyrophana mollusca]
MFQQEPPLINAPEGDGGFSSGPQLHIVPATPVSGGGAASQAVPFQSTLETLHQGKSDRITFISGSAHLQFALICITSLQVQRKTGNNRRRLPLGITNKFNNNLRYHDHLGCHNSMNRLHSFPIRSSIATTILLRGCPPRLLKYTQILIPTSCSPISPLVRVVNLIPHLHYDLSGTPPL